jgi:hypothetical protein
MVLYGVADSRPKQTGKLEAGSEKKSFLPFLLDIVEKTANGRKRVELLKLQHELLLRGWHP